MRTFIFAIGGTGARFLRSLTMLLASGCKDTKVADEIVPVIIDYDATNGDTDRTQELLETYQRINRAIYVKGDKVLESFFCTPLTKLKELFGNDGFDSKTKFEVAVKHEAENDTFANHIQLETLGDGNGTLATRHLLEILYDNSPKTSKTTELYLDLKVGFKGCPNIGCVVTKSLENSVELQKFFHAVNPASGDKILIVGSIFGGTGASGIPMLLDLIRERPNLANCTVGVIAVTPYFKVAPNKDSAINSDSFTAKTKAALDAYSLGRSVNKQADAIYYVGDSYLPGAFENSEGGATQKNKAHVVELAAAMEALHFMNTSFDHSLEADAVAHEFGFAPVTKKEEKKEAVDQYTLNFSRFYKDETLVPYIYPLARLMLFAKFCESYFLEAGKGEQNDIWLRNGDLYKEVDFKKDLAAFVTAFKQWVDELEDSRQKRGLKLFNADKDYDNIFAGIVTAQTVALVLSSQYVSNKKIREALTVEYRDKKIDKPRSFFIAAIDKVLKEIFADILQKNAEK